jgi:hypothetical protein
MLLDTGAAYSSLDREWAKSAGLKIERTDNTAAGLGASDVTIGTAKVELSLGTQSENATTAVFDFTHINSGLTRNGVPKIAGILGDSTLQHFAAVIDYPGTRLYLMPRDLQVPTELAGNWQGIKEERDGKPVDPPSTWWVDFSNGQVRLTQDGVTVSYRSMFGPSGTNSVTLECVMNRKPVSHPAVYCIKDGRLTLCMRINVVGGETGPPKTLSTKAGDGCVLIELVRNPPDQ